MSILCSGLKKESHLFFSDYKYTFMLSNLEIKKNEQIGIAFNQKYNLNELLPTRHSLALPFSWASPSVSDYVSDSELDSVFKTKLGSSFTKLLFHQASSGVLIMKMGKQCVGTHQTCSSLERVLKLQVEMVSSVYPICHPTSNH